MLLRPSKSHVWSKCPANPTFETRVPAEPPTDEAREGTCAAWVADATLKGEVSSPYDLLGKTHENGWLVTPDMCEHIHRYVELIRSFGGVLATEKFVQLSENIGGTLDCSTSLANGTIRVIDLKYGRKLVEVFENTQVIIYGAAEMKSFLERGQAVTRVELGIYQPRAWHHEGIYRPWVLTPQELWNHAVQLIQAGNLCLAPKPLAVAGPHCVHCNARLGCAAFMKSIANGAEWLATSIHQRRLTADELREFWTFADALDSLVGAAKKAAGAEVESRMNSGEHIPGLYLKPRTGNRRFKYGPEVVQALTGIDPTAGNMVTPAELERRGANLDIVEHLTETPSLAPVVAKMPPDYFRKVFK